jgi:adenine-specific DNA-methyltransferase
MKKLIAEDTETKSPDLVAGDIEQLKALFPEAFTEGKVDFEVLKQLLGSAVEEREEKYGLNWYGKRRARQIALTPSTGTLRPGPEDSVEWDTTRNLMIEGDSLEVLKLFQKSYAGKVKLIYIDPPYNTGRDFVYPDDFKDNIRNYLELTGQVDGNGNKISSNTEASGRFHTDWLNMMYPRLKLARNLLRDDGVIFISIGESELHNLICLCDHVFGSECAIGVACRIAKKSNNKGDYWAPNFDYIVTYSKDKASTTPFSGGVNTPAYDQVEVDGPRKGEHYQLVRLYMSTIENQNPEQRFWIDCPDGTKVIPPGDTFPPERPKLGDGIWRWTRSKFEAERDRIVIKSVRSSNLLDQNRQPAKWNVFTKTYLKDVIENATSKPNNLIEDHINQIGSHEMTTLGIPFDYPKPSTLIKFLCEISQSRGEDIVLDFFAGSGTTGDAVMAQNVADGENRRYILVQLPEPLDPADAGQKDSAAFCDQLGRPRTIAELTKERLRRAARKIREENPMFAGDLGFRVFRLASSNIRAWEPNRDDLPKTLEASIEHLKTDRTEQDILFELLLKLGLDLTVPIEQKAIADKTVHSIGAGTLLVCLATKITREEVEPLALGIADWHMALAPAGESTVVFRDSAFADDVAKTNLVAILVQHGFDETKQIKSL